MLFHVLTNSKQQTLPLSDCQLAVQEISLPACPPARLPACPPAYLSLSVCLSVCLPACLLQKQNDRHFAQNSLLLKSVGLIIR